MKHGQVRTNDLYSTNKTKTISNKVFNKQIQNQHRENAVIGRKQFDFISVITSYLPISLANSVDNIAVSDCNWGHPLFGYSCYGIIKTNRNTK